MGPPPLHAHRDSQPRQPHDTPAQRPPVGPTAAPHWHGPRRPPGARLAAPPAPTAGAARCGRAGLRRAAAGARVGQHACHSTQRLWPAQGGSRRAAAAATHSRCSSSSSTQRRTRSVDVVQYDVQMPRVAAHQLHQRLPAVAAVVAGLAALEGRHRPQRDLRVQRHASRVCCRVCCSVCCQPAPTAGRPGQARPG